MPCPLVRSRHIVQAREIESKARFNGTCNTTEKDTLVTSQVVKPETVDTEK